MEDKNERLKIHTLNEGELRKKGGFFKRWRSRFVVLNEEMLLIFERKADESKGRPARHSLAVENIFSIEKHESKKRSYCFRFVVENKGYIFCCPTEIARDLWIRMIKEAKQLRNEPKEQTLSSLSSDNPTVTINQLNPGIKQVRIERPKGQGLGCTIKTIGGVTCVGRILEDGPVSATGVLRPGDEIIEVNGIKISGLSTKEISEIIKASPEVVECKIKPVDSKPVFGPKQNVDGNYIGIDHKKTAELKQLRDAEDEVSETIIQTPKDFGPSQEVPPRTGSRIKQSYAFEYEDDRITALSRRDENVSKNSELENENVFADTPLASITREHESDANDVNIGAADSTTEDVGGLTYIYLDFSSTPENEDPGPNDTDNVSSENRASCNLPTSFEPEAESLTTSPEN